MKTLFLISFFLLFASLVSGQTNRNPKLPLDTLKRLPDSLMLRIKPDARSQFPGSSNFYRKWPQADYRYEKSFIVKPDTSVRYYLLIKDPLTNKVTKY